MQTSDIDIPAGKPNLLSVIQPNAAGYCIRKLHPFFLLQVNLTCFLLLFFLQVNLTYYLFLHVIENLTCELYLPVINLTE